jgi:hypothetical protein
MNMSYSFDIDFKGKMLNIGNHSCFPESRKCGIFGAVVIPNLLLP